MSLYLCFCSQKGGEEEVKRPEGRWKGDGYGKQRAEYTGRELCIWGRRRQMSESRKAGSEAHRKKEQT
jgi:hypothetical protein